MQPRIALARFLSTLGLCAAPAEVRVWETNVVVPTYHAAPPSSVPRFYDGRTYQGAKATFYPYPIQDVLTDIKTNKSYRVLFLENDYVQISVIPELGGRMWSALDKVNGHDFFYRQPVVKPALIGTACDALGDKTLAKAAFEQAVKDAASAKAASEQSLAGRGDSDYESDYFGARALQNLGRKGEAKPIFKAFVKIGEEQLAKGEGPDYFAKFGEKMSERVRQANAHYLIALGQLAWVRKRRPTPPSSRLWNFIPPIWAHTC